MIKEELQPVHEDLDGLKRDINSIQQDFDWMQQDIIDMKKDISHVKIQQEEQGQLMKILLDKTETNKVEHDLLSQDMTQVTENIDGMRKDLSTLEILTARNMERIAHLKAIK